MSDLTSNILIPVSSFSGTLPIANGGTNSSTALSGSSIMVSDGSKIVQGAAGTTTTVLHGNAAGAPTYSAVSLTADVSNILPVANGGTNSSTALSGSSIMISDGSKIVQGPAGTSSTLLHGNASGSPTYGTVNLSNEVSGTLGTARGGTGVTSFTVNGVLFGNGAAIGSLTPVANGAISYNGSSVLQAGTLGVSSGGTGQTSFTNGQLLIGNTTGNTLTKATITAGVGISVTNGAGSIKIDSTGQPFINTWIFEDRKSTGTNAPNSVSGTQARLFNTTAKSDGATVTLDAGTGIITLTGSSSYRIQASCPAYGVGGHQCSVFDIGASGILGFGTSENAPASTQTRSFADCCFFLASTTTIRVDHWCQNVSTNGLGKAVSSGMGSEVYSRIIITKLA